MREITVNEALAIIEGMGRNEIRTLTQSYENLGHPKPSKTGMRNHCLAVTVGAWDGYKDWLRFAIKRALALEVIG